jgi:uncharacterized membrane protein HdeD (DUF308 family)
MEMLARNWGWMALRGLAALCFGVFTLSHPGISLIALFLVFGGYALVDGVFTIISAIAKGREEPRWGGLMATGAAGIVLGVITLILLRFATFVLLYCLAAWAIVTGFAGLFTALRLRKLIQGESLLAVSSGLSIAFGILLLVFPGLGALTVHLWIGVYASLFGLVLMALAFRLRSWGKEHPSGAAVPQR